MELSNLKARPDKFHDTVKLIERSFGYQSPNRFKIDFYPLMKQENRENCHIALDKGEVVAHTGIAKKTFKISDETFGVYFIGGVAVAPSHRGQGLSTLLLENIFRTFPQAAFYALWSEKIDLYRKYAFFPCVELFETPQNVGAASSFKREEFARLGHKDLERVKLLYKSCPELRPERSEEEWNDLKSVSSAQFYVKRDNGEISNYFFKNKGQDLIDVVHEYGNLKDRGEFAAHGKLWSSLRCENSTPLFGTLIKIGDFSLFSRFVERYTLGAIALTKLDEAVRFSFQGSDYKLSTENFLQGLLGPGRFEELGKTPKLFIPGLDSV